MVVPTETDWMGKEPHPVEVKTPKKPLTLEQQLRLAEKEERYEDAAQIRDKLSNSSEN